jgi:lysophospholipase L1-like esterase
MALLHRTVSDDGTKFVVMAWPGFYRIDPDWQRRFTKKVGRIPADFKPFAMEARLQEIADRNHITLDFLYPYFQAYRDAHKLEWPYFSFTCDPHYSALGHQVFAEAIVQKLEEHHLLPEPAASPR